MHGKKNEGPVTGCFRALDFSCVQILLVAALLGPLALGWSPLRKEIVNDELVFGYFLCSVICCVHLAAAEVGP